jgi:PGF-pre-PGF domain-containing protein
MMVPEAQRYGLVLAAVLVTVLGLAVPAGAAPVVVIDNSSTITGSLAGVDDGGTLILNPGTYFEHDILLSRDITITANTSIGGSAADTILDAQSLGRIFNNSGDHALTISSLAMQNGKAGHGGAIDQERGRLAITNSTFTRCTATSDDGGAIYSTSGPLTITGSTFTGCSAPGSGGAIYHTSNDLLIRGSTFQDCSARDGGAIYVLGTVFIIESTRIFWCQASEDGGAIFVQGSVTIRNGSDFDSCSAGRNGGAIFSDGSLTVQDSSIHYCSAAAGGAVYLASYSGLTAHGASFAHDTATGQGGALYAESAAQMTFDQNSDFTSCSAGSGGAIYNNGGILTIDGTTFSECSAQAEGGAIYNASGTITIDHTTFPECSAQANGGAIYNEFGTITITDTIFSDCSSSSGNGGAIYTYGGWVYITGCTFSICSADNGGAIAGEANLSLIIDNTQIQHCRASEDGGAVSIRHSSNVYIRNNSWILLCSAGRYGGAIFSESTVTMEHSAITDCSAAAGGGAIYQADGSGHLVVHLSSFYTDRSTAGAGGAIFAGSGTTLTIDQDSFGGCRAGSGGAIFNGGGTVTISGSQFAGCSGEFGGAILNHGDASILSTTLISNEASEGGAIYNNGTIPSVTFCRFFNNTARSTGSAIGNDFSISNATNNWWGANSDPAGSISGPVPYTPWIVLSITASPASITPSQSSVIRVNLTNTSAGSETASGGTFVPDRIPVAFGLSSGTGMFSPPGGNFSSGTNTTVFSPASDGIARITAIVDGQTVFIDIPVRFSPPVISGITPATGPNSTAVSISDLAGAEFRTGAVVNLTRAAHTNITATGVTVVSGSQITCLFPITGAEAGSWDVVVINPDGQEANLASGFTITAPDPSITGITPATGLNTSSVSITDLAGTGFQDGAVVNLTRAGHGNITAIGVTTVSGTQITCSLPITGVEAGRWDVVVTNPDGQEGVFMDGFIVTFPAPTLITTPATTGTIAPVATPDTRDNDDFPSSGAAPSPAGASSFPPMTVTVNIGGNSAAGKATVTGTKLAGLVLTGTVQNAPGTNQSSPAGRVFQYVRLEPAAYGSITGAVITFSVPQSWLEENRIAPGSVVLWHQAPNGWEQLPTSFLNTRDGTAYFSAVSPGFSLFAIAGTPGSAAPAVTAAQVTTGVLAEDRLPVTAAASRTPVTTVTTVPPATNPQSSGPSPLMSIVLVIAAIGMIGAGGLVARR